MFCLWPLGVASLAFTFSKLTRSHGGERPPRARKDTKLSIGCGNRNVKLLLSKQMPRNRQIVRCEPPVKQ
jgi:hypothetical protein